MNVLNKLKENWWIKQVRETTYAELSSMLIGYMRQQVITDEKFDDKVRLIHQFVKSVLVGTSPATGPIPLDMSLPRDAAIITSYIIDSRPYELKRLARAKGKNLLQLMGCYEQWDEVVLDVLRHKPLRLADCDALEELALVFKSLSEVPRQ